MGDIFIRHRRLLAAILCWQQTAMPNEEIVGLGTYYYTGV